MFCVQIQTPRDLGPCFKVKLLYYLYIFFPGCYSDSGGRPCSTQQFVVQVNHKRAEPTQAHKVTAEDVDPAHPGSHPLLARPAEQHGQSLHRHLLHVLERMEEDVRSVLRQVQAAGVKAIWKTKRYSANSSTQ